MYKSVSQPASQPASQPPTPPLAHHPRTLPSCVGDMRATARSDRRYAASLAAARHASASATRHAHEPPPLLPHLFEMQEVPKYCPCCGQMQLSEEQLLIARAPGRRKKDNPDGEPRRGKRASCAVPPARSVATDPRQRGFLLMRITVQRPAGHRTAPGLMFDIAPNMIPRRDCPVTSQNRSYHPPTRPPNTTTQQIIATHSWSTTTSCTTTLRSTRSRCGWVAWGPEAHTGETGEQGETLDTQLYLPRRSDRRPAGGVQAATCAAGSHMQSR